MTIVIPNWNYLSTSQGIEGLLPVAAETPWEEPTPASSHGTMIDEDVMIQWWICNNVLIICNVYVCILYIYYIYIVYTRVLSLYMYNSDVCICIQYTSIRCIVPRSYTFGHGKSPSGSLDIWTWLHGEVSGSFHCQVGIWVMFSKVYRIHYPFIQIGPLASINPFSFFLRVRPFMLHWFLRTRVGDGYHSAVNNQGATRTSSKLIKPLQSKEIIYWQLTNRSTEQCNYFSSIEGLPFNLWG